MNETVEKQVTTLTLGQILKTAREKQALSKNDIASQLNLQPNVINALEDDDPDSLPAPTYVRGYIRSCARILKLDADQLIKIYDENASATPELLPDVKHTQITSSDKPVKLTTYLITFALVLLLFAWWQSHFIVDRLISSSDNSEDVNVYTEYGGALDYDYEIVVHPDTLFLEQEISGINPEEGNNDTGDELNEAPVQTYNLVLEIEKSSWIEVTDSNNNKIYHDIAKPGESIKLEGNAPFSVLLGFAPGVKVYFNGNQFNTNPFTNAGVAKFKLGE